MAGKKIVRTQSEQLAKTGDWKTKTSTPSGAGMLSERAWAAIAESYRLSPREMQIIRGIFDNHTEHGIAAALGISKHTIHTYLTRIFRKLDATTRTQVVLRVMEQFLALTSATDKPTRSQRGHLSE
jgi:DNA-binding NarL/FixJ family response regulator